MKSSSNYSVWVLVAAIALLAYILYPSHRVIAHGKPTINFTEALPDVSPVSLGNGLISWTARLDNRYFLRDGSREHHLYINVKGGVVEPSSDRAPLNISVVLDRSGSMSGEKMSYTKKAVQYIIQQLHPKDYLSIVNYDDVVEVTSPSQHVRHKNALLDWVASITARGSTNLMGGTQTGYDQVLSTKRSHYVNRVLLLTDGLANVGITDPQRIKPIVQSWFRENGVAISTFGVGADYNEDLLTMMAETGHGNYYFIDQPDRIASIFEKELNGLLSVLAQSTVLKVALPPGITCEKVFGVPAEIGRHEIAINLNDIYSNDERAIIIKLKSSPFVAQAAITTSLSFFDTKDKATIQSSITAMLQPTHDAQLVKRHQDVEVKNTLTMFQASEQMDEMLKDADNSRYNEAKMKAQKTIKVLQEQQAVAPSAILKKQEEQLQRYAEDLENAGSMSTEEVKVMQKSNKAGNYKTRTMKK